VSETGVEAWIGMAATGGLILCAGAILVAFMRFKELRMRRVIAVLEWLATNGPSPLAQDRPGREFELDLGVKVSYAWGRLEPLFHDKGRTSYFRLVWDASLRDLYWANRFGSELQRLSLFPLPSEVQVRSEERGHIVATHIRDFLLLVDQLLPEGRPRGQE
jgi:hypothetical protein